MRGLSAQTKLEIDVAKIPPEGTEVNAELEAHALHLEGEGSFVLQAGGGLRCRVERGEEDTVHVFGHLGAQLGLECHRCLEPFSLPVEMDLDLYYLPHREGTSPEEEDEQDVELSDRDMVVAYYRGERVDLGEMVREQLLLSIPMKRVCRSDCRGLCPICGTNRNQAPCECRPEPDLRLAPLRDILKKGSH